MTREMALDEFARFCQLMDLTDKLEEKMSEEDAKSLENCRSTILRAIENGSLVIDEEGVATFTPRRGGKPLVFAEPSAGILLAADKRREGHNTAKTVAILTEWTHENAASITALKPGDFAVCTSLFALFFG